MLRQQLEAQALAQLKAIGAYQEPLLLQVQQLVTEQLCDGAPDIETVAQRLNFSTRALQRKLNDLNSSFSHILDQTRRDLSLGYIQQAHLSLTEIAFLVGFSEQSAFNRAFKRWTAVSPSDYRKQL